MGAPAAHPARWRFKCRQNNTGLPMAYARRGTARSLAARAVDAGRLPVLQAALVAAELLLHPDRRLVGARVGVGRHRLRLERYAGIEMNGALGAKAEAVLLDRHGPGIAAVEVFLERFHEPRIDPLAQGLADVEVLARDAKRHGGDPRSNGPCLTPPYRAPPACRGAA